MSNTIYFKNYHDLTKLKTFDDRFSYLKMTGTVGADTFGFDRIFNQRFYASAEWKAVRRMVIIRDNGCDLGVEGHDIFGKILIHHMNPITLKDIQESTDFLLNPEYLICVSHETHNAIHYGRAEPLRKEPVERFRNDTCPWKRFNASQEGG